MPVPTLNFPTSGILTAAGSRWFEVIPRAPYQIVTHGGFGGATVTMEVYDPILDGVYPVAGASWTDDFEGRFRSPYELVSLTVTGGTGPYTIAPAIGPLNNTIQPS